MILTKESLQLIKNGDRKAQWELYDHFKAKLMGVCWRYSSNKEEAEDIFQETFILVFQKLDQLHELEKLEAWIKKIAVNTAVNYYHKNKRYHYADEKNGFHKYDEEYELIMEQFSDEMLVQMINDLPEGYRMVFNLHVIEGYSHGEIGKLLHITEATSRSQLTRAKAVLKDKLNAVGVNQYEKYE